MSSVVNSSIKNRELTWLYERLLATYGPQHWWPAESVFEMMAGAVLVQNTAWTSAARAIQSLKEAELLSAEALAALSQERLAELIRASGYRNVKAERLQALCRWLLDMGGVRGCHRRETARLRDSLLQVHGVGRETADAILLYGFERPVFVVDAYAFRILERLGWWRGRRDYEALRRAVERTFGTEVRRLNELHALLVEHGKRHCRPKPRCRDCPLAARCAHGGSLPRA